MAIPWLRIGLLAGSLALGLNILFVISGLVDLSGTFQEVSARQMSINYQAGLLRYAIIIPIIEELLFRLLLYNLLRRLLFQITNGMVMGVLLSQIIVSGLFAFYHGNLVQGIYGFIMAMAITLVYEKMGKFPIAVYFHGLANFVVFSITYDGEIYAAVCNPVCCLILLATALLSWKRIK